MTQPLFLRSVQNRYRSLVVYCGLILFISLLLIQIQASSSALCAGREVNPDADVICPVQEDQPARQLEPGKPIELELAGGQSHSYQLALDAGQYVKLVVDQRGIDVVVHLSGPDDKQFLEFDSESRNRGKEIVEQVAEAAGRYRLTVQPKQKGASAGGYEIRVEEMRVATENDRALHEARKLLKGHIKLHRAGKYDEALMLVERALEIREKTLEPDHPHIAAAMNDSATVYRDRGDYTKAEHLFQRALAIREKALGLEHPHVAASLNGLAILYTQRGEFAKAEPLFHRSLDIQEKSLGPDHPDVVKLLNNLANFYSINGAYAKAEPFFQRALTIREKTLGPEHPDIATSLHNFGTFYHEIGEYARAEQLLLRALAIREKVLEADHPWLATTLNNLALVYDDKGDYAKAEQLHLRALAIRERSLGPEHSDVAMSLHNLATSTNIIGDYAKVEPLFQRALAIREKALGPEHPEVAQTLNNLAILYHNRGDYVKAEPAAQRALVIKEKALGSEHPLVATSLNNLANIYRDIGDYAKAEPLYQRVLAIQEKAIGPQHPDVAPPLYNLAVLYAAKGDITQAISFQSRSNAVVERNLSFNLVTGSERQKLAYLAHFSNETDFTLSLHNQAAPDDPQAIDLAFTTLLRRKGRGLDAMTDMISALRRRATPQDQALFGKLAEARSRLAALTLKDSGAANPATYRASLRLLEEEVEKLEAELSTRSAEFRAQSQPVTLAAVQAALPSGSALIEFAVHTPQGLQTRKNKPPRYLAYLLPAQGQPKWVDLGDAAPIDRAVDDWRKSLRNPNRPDVKRLARTLDDKVMRPVRSLLREMPLQTRRLLIAPDGSLNLVPFAALVDEQYRYLIERYSISYLTSGRDLLRLQTTQPSRSDPLVVADPDFDRVDAVAVRGVQNPGRSQEGNRGVPQSDITDVSFPPLPGTKAEALAVKAALPDASLLLQEQATETALKQAKAPRFLHIATHGFFLSNQEAPPAETRGVLGDDPLSISDLRLSKWAAYIKDPLLRSGLALTGANQGPSGDDDGLLTALEVAGLDLWGTRLVVLSACDTGVGEVRNGEGVYGLRRALVLAGSESQMMSLWPVLDKRTKDLMIPYYKALRRGEGRGEALRQVQLQMLRSKYQSHPFYWAAFILSGEWRELDGPEEKIKRQKAKGKGRLSPLLVAHRPYIGEQSAGNR